MAHFISSSFPFIVLLLVLSTSGASEKTTDNGGNSPVQQDNSLNGHENLTGESPSEENLSASVESLLEETFDRLVSENLTSEKPTIEEETTQQENTTTSSNDTSSVPSHRWPCKSFNITSNASTVILNNETEYTSIFARMNSTHGCGLLLFYSPHCEFCTKLAPLYNALGRAYPDLAVMAVNVEEVMRMAAGFGVVGIPTIFFFYSGRPVSKFNQSRDEVSFQKFIQDLAGYSPLGGSALNISDADIEGPIKTQVIESRDYYLIFSSVFLATYLLLRCFGNKLLNILAHVVLIYFRIQDRLVAFWSHVKTHEEVIIDEKVKTD